MAKINTEQWLAELDRVASFTPTHSPIVLDRGFTIYDMMDRHEMSRSRASGMMANLIRSGKVKHVGYRKGRNPMKVYELG